MWRGFPKNYHKMIRYKIKHILFYSILNKINSMKTPLISNIEELQAGKNQEIINSLLSDLNFIYNFSQTLKENLSKIQITNNVINNGKYTFNCLEYKIEVIMNLESGYYNISYFPHNLECPFSIWAINNIYGKQNSIASSISVYDEINCVFFSYPKKD